MRSFADQLAVLQPTFQPSPSTTLRTFVSARASQRPVFSDKTFEDTLDALIKPLVKVRKVITIYQGGIYRSRFEGRPNFTFGSSPSQAAERLKFFASDAKNIPMFKAEDREAA
jgi:hypothetical protein